MCMCIVSIRTLSLKFSSLHRSPITNNFPSNIVSLLSPSEKHILSPFQLTEQKYLTLQEKTYLEIHIWGW